MSDSWGTINITAVASNGVATQLFPATVAVGVDTTDATGAYPPTGGGLVRRPSEGWFEKITATPDGVNGGLLEIWDCGGLDRGDAENVNTATAISDTYLTANGKLLYKVRITATAEQPYDLSSYLHHVRFNKGLAVRFVAAGGTIAIMPFVENGFSLQYVAG